MTKTVRTNAFFPKRKARIHHPFVRNLIIYLLTFCLSVAFLRQAIPKVSQTTPYIPRISEKLAYFEQHKDEFEAVFIGSSRIYRQVSPEVFSREVETRLGQGIKSFNFGIPAMRMPETYFWLGKILSMKPKNLKWVFVEANLSNVDAPLANARTNRAIHWHTPASTLMTLKYILSRQEPPSEKASSAYSHLLPLFYNLLNLGGFSNEFDAFTNPARLQIDSVEKHDSLGNAVDGYRPLDEVSAEGPVNRRKVYLEQLDLYRESVSSFAAEPVETSPVATAGDKAFILNFSELISQANAAPIFVIPPRLAREGSLTSLYVEGQIETLLAFNNPSQYPTLFEPEYRFDENHLNAQGSEIFTSLLADHFVQSLNLLRSMP
ncbi:MAG: hypothetical protein AAGC93_13395 [Cyanobacteria bacterium P01_F01_bin.53]